MLRLPAGIVIAIAAHLAIVGWLATRGGTTVTPRAAEVVAPPPPIDIALLQLDDAPPVDVARPDAHRAHVERTALRAVTRPTPAVAPSRLAMRGTDPIPVAAVEQLARQAARPLDLSPHAWDALDHVPAGTVAQAPTPAPTPPTRADLEDSTETETFAIDVSRDGTAHLHDKWNLHLPTTKQAHDFALGPEQQRSDGLRPGDGPPTAGVPDIGVTIAKFDITDFAMRLHGDDPYASEKLHALDATRDRRVEIGAKHEHDQLAHAGWLVQSNLDHLWATIHDPAARKRALFEIWDECAETGSQDLIDAGASARGRVIKLIREKLPAGGPDAFTAAELDAFNRDKQSHAQFAPY